MSPKNWVDFVATWVFAMGIGFVSPGCYEGTDEGDGRPSKDPTPEPSPSPADKPLYYVLIQTIRLSREATAQANCFSSQNLRDYKNTEWDQREAFLKEGLSQVSDRVEFKSISISASDCTQVLAIRNAALNALPWPGGAVPEEDDRGRPVIDLKVVYWDEEPQTLPPDVVTAEHWASALSLIQKGRRARSFSYFVVSRSQSGYFQDWKSLLSEELWLSGTPLDSVDPTDAGIQIRNETISNDTSTFVSWLVERGT